MKDCIDIPGFNDVVIFSDLVPVLKRDEQGKVITEEGEIVPHTKNPKSISFYIKKYNSDGMFTGIELMYFEMDHFQRILDKVEDIKRSVAFDAPYYNDDLPF